MQHLDPAWYTPLVAGKLRSLSISAARSLVDFMIPFAGMWDRHLRNIKSVQHWIEIRPESNPVFQSQYCTGPQFLAQEEEKIDEMLEIRVIDVDEAA